MRGSWANRRGDGGEKVGSCGGGRGLGARARETRAVGEVAVAKLARAQQWRWGRACPREEEGDEEEGAGPRDSERGRGWQVGPGERERRGRAAWAGLGRARERFGPGFWVSAQN